jgi:peptide-methionine (S)-S-oxide reductase
MLMIWHAVKTHSTRRVFCLKSIVGLLTVATAVLAEGQKIMAEPPKGSEKAVSSADQEANAGTNQFEEATFGSGCFWCTEAVFQQLKGVKSVVSGYCGGHTKNPTYKEVCTGETGHAEVIRVTYDPKVVTYPELLEVFWKTHDPTTLNRQGADVGTQYRSVIFYHNEIQHKLANEYLNKLDASGAFKKKIVTEISPLKEFYPGEDYHQNYYRDNPRNPYCSTVVKHKVDKFKAVFKDKLKNE